MALFGFICLINISSFDIFVYCWRCGIVVISSAQFHSMKPKFRFSVGSNPGRSMSEIRDDENLWQWSRPARNKAQCFLLVNHITKTIHYHH